MTFSFHTHGIGIEREEREREREREEYSSYGVYDVVYVPGPMFRR